MCDMLVRKIKYWAQLILLPLYGFSFLMPRDKKIWVFGSTFGRRFSDNPRYFYLYICQHEKCIRPVWISRNRQIVEWIGNNGYEAYYYRSLKGIWYCLRAKYYVYDNYAKDINFWLSGGAVKLNLWHGIPLKKIQQDNIFDKVRHPENHWQAFKAFPRTLSDEKKSHYVLTTSEFMRPVFESAFNTKRVFVAGYPRIDSFAGDEISNILTDTESNVYDRIQAVLGQDDRNKMIYYMPTFRDSETDFFNVIDMERLQSFLAAHHMVLCTKLHCKSKLRAEFAKLEGGNIVNIDADTDPYVYIKLADVLITDYSSVYFDFLFTGRPIVFFAYDLEKYLTGSRELYFDYGEYTPGFKAKDQRELEEALLQAVTGRDGYERARDTLKEKMFDMADAGASRRLIEAVWERYGR